VFLATFEDNDKVTSENDNSIYILYGVFYN